MVLRPTLMFGWFDRKHLGWLSRFMKKSPIFPVPGHGGYLRQPLYAADFCQVIISCIRQEITGASVEISGKEKIPYLDIIRAVRESTRSRTPIVRIPYSMFYLLLKIYALFDRDPPFTVSQLKALVVDELFEDADWETLFSVRATPFKQAIEQTFTHPQYSAIELEF
jgi:nucleoside-diphosphate-sugar epimerase